MAECLDVLVSQPSLVSLQGPLPLEALLIPQLYLLLAFVKLLEVAEFLAAEPFRQALMWTRCLGTWPANDNLFGLLLQKNLLAQGVRWRLGATLAELSAKKELLELLLAEACEEFWIEVLVAEDELATRRVRVFRFRQVRQLDAVVQIDVEVPLAILFRAFRMSTALG